MRLLLQQQQNRRRILHRSPKTKPRIQRYLPHRSHRHIAQIHCHHPKPASLNQQIRSAQRLLNILTTHPKQFSERNPRRIRRQGIETVPRVHQRAHFSLRRSRSQSRKQQARPPRTSRPANFGHGAARQSPHQSIDLRNAGGNKIKNIAVAIGERRGDPSTKSGFDFGAEGSEGGRHGGSVGWEQWYIFAFCSPIPILRKSPVLVKRSLFLLRFCYLASNASILIQPSSSFVTT